MSLYKNIFIASTFRSRIRGLFAFPFDFSDVLILAPCRSVHTFGLDREIDIAFFDKNMQITKAFRDVKPGTIKGCLKSYGTLERYASDEPWFEPGKTIQLVTKL